MLTQMLSTWQAQAAGELHASHEAELHLRKANARKTADMLTSKAKQELEVSKEQKHRQLARAAAVHGAATQSFTSGGCPTRAPKEQPHRRLHGMKPVAKQ